MALQVNKTLKVSYCLSHNYGIDVKKYDTSLSDKISKEVIIKDAYVKVLSINGTKDLMDFNVGIYTDSIKSQLITTRAYSFMPVTTYDSDNFIKQAYEHLKTLDEYVGAVDVLEDGQML